MEEIKIILRLVSIGTIGSIYLASWKYFFEANGYVFDDVPSGLYYVAFFGLHVLAIIGVFIWAWIS